MNLRNDPVVRHKKLSTHINDIDNCVNKPVRCRLITKCGCERNTYIRSNQTVIEIALEPTRVILDNNQQLEYDDDIPIKTRKFQYTGKCEKELNKDGTYSDVYIFREV